MNYKYYKGSFTGLSKTKNYVLNIGKHSFYDFHWSNIHIKNIEAIEPYDEENEKVGDFYYTNIIKPKGCFRWPFYLEFIKSSLLEIKNKKDFFWIEYVAINLPKIKRRPEIFISVNEQYYFDENIHDVIVKDIVLNNDPSSYIKKDFIELNGTIYFKIEIPEVEKPKSQVVTSNTGMNRSDDFETNNTIIEKKINTTGHIISSPIDDFSNSSSKGSETNKTGSTFPRVSSKFFGILFGIILWLILLAFFKLILPQYFIFALIGSIGWVISRFLNSNALKKVFNIIFVALFLVFLANLLSNKGALIEPTVPKKDGDIKISSPKEIKSETGDDSDYEITKEINWYDFITNNYGVKYNTYVKSFFETQRNHISIDKKYRKTSKSALSYFNKLYINLENFDNQKTDSIVNLLKQKAVAKKLNSIQTAEMVIAFIQEIPYVLVHQNSCENIQSSEPRNSFIAKYHQDKKPCLPNVAGGVQSPYEFLHNLKGDCDTRSLLGYTILKKLNISASIWVSEAYGHSILGVGLPVGNGVYKTIKGLNHYGVELTNKGFRLGMIAPQQRDMSNWDIALYSNTFK